MNSTVRVILSYRPVFFLSNEFDLTEDPARLPNIPQHHDC